MAATGTASMAISLSSRVPAALMPILVSQRFRFDTISLRLGHKSSISAIARNTLANTASLMGPSLWPMRPSMGGC